MISAFKNLTVLSILILSFPSSSFSTRIRIRNNCTYTVWPAALPGGGRELRPGQAYDLSITAAGPGRVWARAGCEFGPDGRGKCLSGDCGGLLECRQNGRAPNTVAGYSLAGRSGGGADSFHVSVGEGFNVPVWFGSECGEAVGCMGDVNGVCPMELRDPGGCNSPCTVFRNAQFCCTLGSDCEATSYSMFFKDLCPDAFTYPSDLGKRSTCRAGTNYEIVFCPSNIAPLQPSELSEYVGVCYSPRGNIPDAQVISLYEQYNVPRLRIYEPNQAILKALKGTDTELMLGLRNDKVPNIASSQAEADAWVKNNVQNFGDVKFKYIAVGSEMNVNLTHLASAIRNIQAAISSHGLSDKIKVSTCISVVFLGASFPPSVGAFSSDHEPFMKFLTSFLVNNRSPLLVTIYPYFTYVANPGVISIDYALFRDPGIVVPDGELMYRNLFDAIMDAFYSALEKLGGKSVEIVVAETSWPSFGDKEDQTEEYAWVYISNLVGHVKNGTPKRPGRPIETYVYAMFEYAEHMGIFWPNKKPSL